MWKNEWSEESLKGSGQPRRQFWISTRYCWELLCAFKSQPKVFSLNLLDQQLIAHDRSNVPSVIAHKTHDRIWIYAHAHFIRTQNTKKSDKFIHLSHDWHIHDCRLPLLGRAHSF